jgi:hypothetical protein
MAFRPSGPFTRIHANLGLLTDLPGRWVGGGFNLIARPFFKNNPPFFLELNGTTESLEFTSIAGDIPNRGSQEPDINLHGLRYLQQVNDCALHAGIHVEPGLWLHVPATTAPAAGETYVRQATIPHGDSLLAQSTFFTQVKGGPILNPVNSTPFTDPVIPGLNEDPKNPIVDPQYLKQYLTDPLPGPCLPPGLDPVKTIKDPTEVLRAQIKGQNITDTVVIQISTVPPGNLANIPFVVQNANALQMDAIFWIEVVQQADGTKIMQLQYVQRVILDFIGIHWPHISVATLIKQ